MDVKFRFDLQAENQPTDQKKTKMEQKWNKNGWLRINRFSMHCKSMEIRPAATVPIWINSVSRGSTVILATVLFTAQLESLGENFH